MVPLHVSVLHSTGQGSRSTRRQRSFRALPGRRERFRVSGLGFTLGLQKGFGLALGFRGWGSRLRGFYQGLYKDPREALRRIRAVAGVEGLGFRVRGCNPGLGQHEGDCNVFRGLGI